MSRRSKRFSNASTNKISCNGQLLNDPIPSGFFECNKRGRDVRVSLDSYRSPQAGQPPYRKVLSRQRNFFSYACSGQRQFSTVSFSGFGLWVRVRVLGSDNHNRFPNSSPNLNDNSNRNITLTPILTPNSS